MLAYKLVPTQKITHAKTWVYCNSKLKWKCYILGKKYFSNHNFGPYHKIFNQYCL